MGDRSAPVNPARRWALLAVIAVLELVWMGWYLAEPLPNAGNVGGRGLDRATILWRALPGVVPGLRYQESYLGLAVEELSHVENLPQRGPILLVAALIAGAAVALGRLVVRALRVGDGLGPWERLALAYGLGTAALGVGTLIAGRLGWIGPGLVRGALLIPIVAELALTLRERRITPARRWVGPVGPAAGLVLVAGPFLMLMVLGAMLPTIDFDAIEYHLQGPKEYFQAGRIRFLPHNVYTSMPFNIEMLHLLGMEVAGDWWRGALAGQVLVALFAPAAAVLIAATATRLGSPRAGWVAAVVYLSTPWIYRLAVLPYVEGPLCFFHAALAWAVARTWSDRAADPVRWGGVLGLLAGGAMAVKYPALLSAVAPFGLVALARSVRDRSPRYAAAFAVGVAVVMAPWLAKNVIDTGNPVYPLGYRVFGGSDWSPAADAKWSAVHGPRPFDARNLVQSIGDVAGRSDWQTPLFTALAPLAFLGRTRTGRRGAAWLAAYAAYLFGTWWLLTHRLDRFWLPMLPSLAVLAGLGADWVRGRAWTAGLALLMAVAIVTNAAYVSTALAGLNEWTEDLNTLRRTVPEMTNPALARLDQTLPPGAKPLLVGQAAVFHFQRPVVYNTVFDDETIETLARDQPPEAVRDGLARLGVTHVYVDWAEIDRYRSPGNYGFTPFVVPEVFTRLVDAGVLDPPTRIGARQEVYAVRPKDAPR